MPCLLISKTRTHTIPSSRTIVSAPKYLCTRTSRSPSVSLSLPNPVRFLYFLARCSIGQRLRQAIQKLIVNDNVLYHSLLELASGHSVVCPRQRLSAHWFAP